MSFSEPFELDFKISFSCLTWRPNMGTKAASQRTTAYLFYSPSDYRTFYWKTSSQQLDPYFQFMPNGEPELRHFSLCSQGTLSSFRACLLCIDFQGSCCSEIVWETADLWEVVTVWLCITFFVPFFYSSLIKLYLSWYMSFSLLLFLFSPYPTREGHWVSDITVCVCCWPGSTHDLLFKHKNWLQKAIPSSCSAQANVDFRSRDLRQSKLKPMALLYFVLQS